MQNSEMRTASLRHLPEPLKIHFELRKAARVRKIRLLEEMYKAGMHDSWTHAGILEAVRKLVRESNSLFEDMAKKVKDYPDLGVMLRDILFCGKDNFTALGLADYGVEIHIDDLSKEEMISFWSMCRTSSSMV